MPNLFPLIIVIVGLVTLYFLYKFLFTSNVQSQVVLSGIKKADMDTPITVTSATLPALTEGGEYTVGFWMYVNNWGYQANYNKHVLSIGSPGDGSTGFHTLLVYLGQQINSLKIRVHATDSTVMTAGTTATDTTITGTVFNNTFTGTGVQGGLLESSHPLCDLPQIDLQRWVYVAVVLNGKTVDVYLDGKLARSCILPTFYRVPAAGYSMRICDRKGFGGYMGGVTTYGYAQSPDEIWKQYMAGPKGTVSFGDYLKSFFDPSSPLNTGIPGPELK